MVIDSNSQSRAFLFSSPQQHHQQQQQLHQRQESQRMVASFSVPIQPPLQTEEDVYRNNIIAENILLSGSLNQINSLNQAGSPPVILSPPPLPDRKPTIEKIWHSQSPRRTPTVSPRASPFSSPRVSPCHTPSGSPSTHRKQSPEEIPPLPKPYNGNSSLLRHNNKNEDGNYGMTMEPVNSQLPPLPARNKRQNRPLSMRSRNIPAASPIHPTAAKNYNMIDRKETGHNKHEPETSFHRRTKSDDQLDRSWDSTSFEEPPGLQRSLSVTKSKPNEHIFNSSNFLFSPQFDSNTSLSGRHLDSMFKGHDSYLAMNVEEGVNKLDLNRPVPVPPSSTTLHTESCVAPQRPTTLSVIVGSRPGSVSDSDAPTPTLPPKKNKMVAPAVCTPDEVMETLNSVAEKVVQPTQGKIEDEIDDEKNSLLLKGDIVEMEDEKVVEGNNDPTMQRKQSEVYYPIPSNDFSREVIACHDFYDADDDAPWKNYDSPVPVINTPTRELQPKWSAGSSDEANTPSTEFVKHTETNDPFLNDSFFKRKGEDGDDENDDVEETPPALPTRSGVAGVTSSNNQNADETREHRDNNIQEVSNEPSSPNQQDGGESYSHPPPHPPSTRSGRQNTSNITYFEQDFEVLMRQGYSHGDIQRALTVAGNNFSIARAILKEFTQNKP